MSTSYPAAQPPHQGFFDPDAAAQAGAAAAAGLHADANQEETTALLSAFLRGILARVDATNDVRARANQPTIENVWLGGYLHDCAPGTRKPWYPPDVEMRFGGYWTCEKDFRGCYHCYWVEYEQVFI